MEYHLQQTALGRCGVGREQISGEQSGTLCITYSSGYHVSLVALHCVYASPWGLKRPSGRVLEEGGGGAKRKVGYTESNTGQALMENQSIVTFAGIECLQM